MRRSLSPRGRATVVATMLIALTFGGCTATGGNQPTGAATPTETAVEAGPTTGTPGQPTQPFGPSCPNLPPSGEGSLQDLATQDWVIALAATPALSQWSVITTVAGLRADFARHSDVTVFVPVDTAFVDLGSARLRQLLSNPPEAGDVLRYHVVTERLSPEQLPGTHQTLAGKPLEVSGSGESFTVNREAKVICGNLQAANATIYLIDRVLQP